MKFRFALILSVALVSASIGCKSEIDNKPAATVSEMDNQAEATPAAKEDNAEAAAERELAVSKEQSKIEFVGAKVTGDHTGGFKEFEGKATLDEAGELTGVEFTVDTTSVWTDTEKLTGHLKSPDFFDVAKHPKSSFVSTKVEPKKSENGTHEITGELDLRGVKKQITFPATIHKTDDGIHATSEFTLKRFDFGINYKGQADDLIKDEVLMKLDLKFPNTGEQG